MWLAVTLLCCWALAGLPRAGASCPSQCSCAFHSLSEGTKARTVVCNDPEMTLPPVNIPVDTSKLRIEKTAIRRVPGEAFHLLHNLEYLWMPYNSLASLSSITFKGLRRLQELRLDGNNLISFPWDSLAGMPLLRLLDLHNNELTSIPPDAARYVKNLTYLDLSSNKLMTLPQALIATWANLQAVPYFPNDNSKIILGLQDNPWVCDCSLYEMVHFLNFQSPNIAFIEPRLKCFTPRSLAGVFFSQVELRKCQSPVVHTSVAKVKTILGSTVLLRCGTTGVPIPELSWRRADGAQLNGTVSTEPISEDTVRSELLIPAARPADAGNYTCTAANFLGNTSVAINLRVVAPWASTTPRGWAPAAPAEPGAHVEVRIAKQTVYGITLEWFAAAAAAAEPGETWYTLLVGRYDAAQKDTIYIGPGVNTYSVTDLLPATKYEVCVAVRNQAPRKGQCVVFVTGSDVSQMEQREKLIHIVVIVCAMVLAVPAGMYACTAEALPGCLARCPSACPRRRRGGPAQAAGSKESTLDSLPAGSEDGLCRTDGGARRPPDRPEPGKARPPHRNSADLY